MIKHVDVALTKRVTRLWTLQTSLRGCWNLFASTKLCVQLANDITRSSQDLGVVAKDCVTDTSPVALKFECLDPSYVFFFEENLRGPQPQLREIIHIVMILFCDSLLHCMLQISNFQWRPEIRQSLCLVYVFGSTSN